MIYDGFLERRITLFAAFFLFGYWSRLRPIDGYGLSDLALIVFLRFYS